MIFNKLISRWLTTGFCSPPSIILFYFLKIQERTSTVEGLAEFTVCPLYSHLRPNTQSHGKGSKHHILTTLVQRRTTDWPSDVFQGFSRHLGLLLNIIGSIVSYGLDMKIGIQILPPPASFPPWLLPVSSDPVPEDNVHCYFINKWGKYKKRFLMTVETIATKLLKPELPRKVILYCPGQEDKPDKPWSMSSFYPTTSRFISFPYLCLNLFAHAFRHMHRFSPATETMKLQLPVNLSDLLCSWPPVNRLIALFV